MRRSLLTRIQELIGKLIGIVMIGFFLTIMSVVIYASFFSESEFDLPKELKKQAKQKADQIKTTKRTVAENRAKYLKLKEAEPFNFYRIYAVREDWESSFKEAEDELERARDEIFTAHVAPLLKENNKKDAANLTKELTRIDHVIKSSIQKSKRPLLRMAELETAQKEASQLVQASQKDMEDINTIIQSLESDIIPQAQKDFPKRADDIIGRFAPLKKRQRDAEAGLQMLQTQFDLHRKNRSADYAILIENANLVHANLNKLKTSDEDYRTRISQLHQSYTKILTDMRIEYNVQIGRTSWNELSDWQTDRDYVYEPSKVDEKVYTYFLELDTNRALASYFKSFSGRFFLGYDSAAHKTYWPFLGIDPKKNWYGKDHNHAEFWIADIFTEAYHKYILVKENGREETDWVLVDEEDYDDNFDNLGMEIVSKPYGFFEDEKIEEASPPGMSLVGNGRYGEWRTDSHTGRSYWHYYGMYAFFYGAPGRYYYRSNWDTWRKDYRGRKPYYGEGGTTGRVYGTYGSHVRTDRRYQNSYFAQKGGLRTPSASVRGAGPGRRGGGPGGRGK